jgi:AcrR family transcriptional regulator
MPKSKTAAGPTIFEMRGPQDHKLRTAIVQAASHLFSHFGYDKTSVADIAREIDVSSAYVYKFFESKAAIGEAVSSALLEELDAQLWRIARGPGTPKARFRLVLEQIASLSKSSYFASRRLHDLTAQAIRLKWQAVATHKIEMKNVLRHVIMDGQVSGDFAPRDSEAAAWAIVDAIYIMAHPLIIEEMLDQDHDLRVRRLAQFLEDGLKVPMETSSATD